MTRHSTVPHHGHGVTAISVDDDRGRLVAVDDAGVVRVWSYRGGTPVSKDIDPESLQGPLYGVAWLPGRDAVAVVGEAGLQVIDLDAKVLGVLPLRGLQALTMVDADHALVAGSDEKLRLLHLPDGRELGALGCGERNTGIARSPGQGARTFAVTACRQGGSRLLWAEVTPGGLVRGAGPEVRWRGDHVSAPAFDATGRFLAAASQCFEVFDVRDGRALHRVDGRGRSRVGLLQRSDPLLIERFWTNAVRYGDVLACGSPEGPIVLLDPAARRPPGLLQDAPRSATALGSDGLTLAAACHDGLIHLWHSDAASH